MNINDLLERRAAKIAELREINTSAMTANRDLDDGERAKFAALETEARALQSQIDRVEAVNRLEKMEAAAESSTGYLDHAQLEARFSLGKALAEHSEGKLTGAEAEYCKEHRSGRQGAFSVPTSILLGGTETRALTTTLPAGGPGGAMVSTGLGPLIDRLRPNLAIETMGATVLRGLTGNLDLPRVKASGTANWVGEHLPATGSDAQFDKVPMGPRTVTAMYEVSRRMLLQATQIEQILRADIGWLLASKLDAAAIQGGGANEPVGIIANAGTLVLPIAANGGPLTVDTAADLQGLVADANASGSGFLTNSKVRKVAAKLKDSQARPYGIGQVFQNEPVQFSNQVPSNLVKGTSGAVCSALIYGAWADLVLGYWSSVDLLANPYSDSVAPKGGMLLHAFLDADVALRHPESFAVCKDVIAA
jgi:HK97 family phage major capsid protein